MTGKIVLWTLALILVVSTVLAVDIEDTTADSYVYSGIWSYAPSNYYDNSWTSYAQSGGGPVSRIWYNYTIDPVANTNYRFKIKSYCNTSTISIPADCMSASTVFFLAVSDNYGQVGKVNCFNWSSEDFVRVYTCPGGSTEYSNLYEESVIYDDGAAAPTPPTSTSAWQRLNWSTKYTDGSWVVAPESWESTVDTVLSTWGKAALNNDAYMYLNYTTIGNTQKYEFYTGCGNYTQDPIESRYINGDLLMVREYIDGAAPYGVELEMYDNSLSKWIEVYNCSGSRLLYEAEAWVKFYNQEPVIYYDFEGYDGITLNNQNGVSFDSTLYNISSDLRTESTTTTGGYNLSYGYDFNGSEQFGTLTDTLDLRNDGWTLSWWSNINNAAGDSTNGDNSFIFSDGSTGNFIAQYYKRDIQISGSLGGIRFNNNDFTFNNWHHYVLLSSQLNSSHQNIRLFYDNSEIIEPDSYIYGNITGLDHFCKRRDNDDYCNGTFDELRLYNYTLSTTEVTQLYTMDESPSLTVTTSASATHNLSFGFYVYDVFLQNVTYNDSCLGNYYNDSFSIPFVISTSENVTNCTLGEHHTNITVCNSLGHCTSATDYWDNYAALTVQAYNYTGGAIQDFQVYIDSVFEGSTSSGALTILDIEGGSRSVQVVPDDYESRTATINMNESHIYYNFTGLYTQNSINFTIRDEITEELITQNVTVEFYSDSYNYNYSTSTGYIYADLIQPDLYTIRYYSDDYGRKRHYYYDLANQSHTNITLYLLNDSFSTDTQVIVYDSATATTLSNIYLKIYRYYQDDNAYKIVAMQKTDSSGSAYLDTQWSTELYRIRVETPYGTSRLTTTGDYIEATPINLYIDVGTEILEDFYNINNVSFDLTWINSSQEFQLYYDDPNAIGTSYCLQVKKWGYYSKTVVNSTCSSSTSSTMRLGGLTTDGTYYAVFTITIDGEDIVVATGWRDIDSDIEDFGSFGLLLTAMILIVFALMSSFHVLSLILFDLGLILSKSLNLIRLDWPYILGLVAVSFILALIIQSRK